MNHEIVLLEGARTAFGTFCGTLRDYTATDLGVFAAKEALNRSGLKPDEIDHVVFGNVYQTSADAPYLARHIGLRAGLPIEVPALTVNRLCGSGFQAIVSAALHLLAGEADFVLAGGAENMSQSPHIIRGARWGIPLGRSRLEDSLTEGLIDTYPKMPMAITAENLAEKYGVTREEADEYAMRSQMAAKAAIEGGRFKQEIVPVEVKGPKGDAKIFDTDEHPRPNTNMEGLARLKPVFKANGIVTAGNASGICDGAAALVMTTAEKAEKRRLKPVGRLLSWGVSGCDPSIMGIGPVRASKIALKKAGLTLEDMELIEVNEAFSPQYLAVEKELKLDRKKTNVNGGAIALGHPVGATGARLTITLLNELKRRGLKIGLASACIGGGQGLTLILQAI